MQFTQGLARFPNNPLPKGVPADRTNEWQGNDGHRDAFRHSYWSARLTQEYGADWARAFTTAHEGLPGNTADREAMDLYNNSVGIQIGAANPRATPEQLADLVQLAVTQGNTVVIDPSGNLEWSDRVGLGQHGLASSEVIAPHLKTPGVVSTQIAAAPGTPPGQVDQGPGTGVAAAQPDTPASRIPAETLSPHAQKLLHDSEQQVRQIAQRHHIAWDQGLDNTVAAVAHQAHVKGLTGIKLFSVSSGEIRFGQLENHILKDGSIDARVAANTPAAVSHEGLAQVDQAAMQRQPNRVAEREPEAMAMRV
ncbi:MAG: hypothetical protein MUF76_11780 [Hydrogenophaga sp.]|nr:hypothetical protein [Hydrogenophaga sp.]